MLVVVEILGGIMAVLLGLSGVIGYFRANVSKSTIELYKEDNEALRTRLGTVEGNLHEALVKIDALESARQYLTSIITQADAIARVQATVDAIAVKVGAV